MRDVGDLIGIRYEARDDSGDLVSATVSVTVTAPGGTTDTPSVTTGSTGLYDASFTANAAGKWRWTWEVSGAITDVASGSVDVGTAVDTYVTLPAFRAALNVAEGDRDDLLRMALSSAARAVDAHTGRPPGGFGLAATATQREFDACRAYLARGRWVLPVDEFADTDDLTVEVGDGTTWTTRTDYRAEPLNALSYGDPYDKLTSATHWGTGLVRFSRRWGRPYVPDQVFEAVMITGMRYHRRLGTRSNVPDDGFRLLDPDVVKLLKPFTPVLIR